MFAIALTVPLSTSAVSAPRIPLENTPTCVTLSRDLKYKSTDSQTGREVSSLQSYLQTKKYLPASAKGYFGPLTVVAVMTFQIDNNISPTGFVGSLTRKKIKALSCAAPISKELTPAEYKLIQDKAVDGQIQSMLANLRPHAELVYSKNNDSYIGICSDAQIKVQINSIVKIASTSLTCLSNATSWAASMSFKSNPSTIFCSNSNGYLGNGSARAQDGVYTCGEPGRTPAPVVSPVPAPASATIQIIGIGNSTRWLGTHTFSPGDRMQIYGTSFPESGGISIDTGGDTIGQMNSGFFSQGGNAIYITVPSRTPGNYFLRIIGDDGRSSEPIIITIV